MPPSLSSHREYDSHYQSLPAAGSSGSRHKGGRGGDRSAFVDRWCCRNPIDNLNLSRIATTCLILLFFSGTMVFIALSVSLFSDIWRVKNSEQDEKDAYNAAVRSFERPGGSRDEIYHWVPGNILIGGGGAVEVEGDEGRADEVLRVGGGGGRGADASNMNTSSVVIPTTISSGVRGTPRTSSSATAAASSRRSQQQTLNHLVGGSSSIARPASILTTPVPIQGHTAGVLRASSVYAEATLPVNVLTPNMLVNFTIGLQNFTPPIVRFISLTKRMRVGAICTPSPSIVVPSSTSSQPPAVAAGVAVSYDGDYDYDGGTGGASASNEERQKKSGAASASTVVVDPPSLKQSSSLSSSSLSSSSSPSAPLATNAPLCTEDDMKAYCQSTYGTFAAYVGSSFCRAGGCGDCYYYSYLSDYCLVVDSTTTTTSNMGYRIFSDPILQSCHYPFTDPTLQNYSWAPTPPTSVTVRVYQRDDPWIVLQQQSDNGDCTFHDQDMSGTIVYLVCCAFAGAFTLAVLWLLYNYMQSRYAFGAHYMFGNRGGGGGGSGQAAFTYVPPHLRGAAADADNDDKKSAYNDTVTTSYSLYANPKGASVSAQQQPRASTLSVASSNVTASSVGSKIARFFVGNGNGGNSSLSKASFGSSMVDSGLLAGASSAGGGGGGAAHPVRNYNDMSTYGMLPASAVLDRSERGGGGGGKKKSSRTSTNGNATTNSPSSSSNRPSKQRGQQQNPNTSGREAKGEEEGEAVGYGYGELPANSSGSRRDTARYSAHRVSDMSGVSALTATTAAEGGGGANGYSHTASLAESSMASSSSVIGGIQ